MLKELEKRKFQRLEFPIDVAVEIVTGKQLPGNLTLQNVKSRNISTTGISLEITTLEVGGINLLTGPPHARENRLLMRIAIFPEEPLFCAIGEVRWYDIVHDSTPFLYHIGVEFVEIKNGGKHQLMRFLKIHKKAGGFLHKFFP